MFNQLYTKKLIWLVFVLGMIPVIFFTHIAARDFYIYYTTAESFARFNTVSYRYYEAYGGNIANSGYMGRAPLVPLILATLYKNFGRTLNVTMIPFALVRILIFGAFFYLSIQYLPRYASLIASLILLLIPRLHTYALSTLDTDSFVLLFFLLSLITFNLLKRNFRRSWLLYAHFLLLALLILTKETGFPLSIGILLLTLHQFFTSHQTALIKQRFITALLMYLVLILPFFYSAHQLGGFLYPNAMTQDKSIWYISENIPNFLYTLILYIGIEELSFVTIKSFVISLFLLFILIIGLLHSVLKRKVELLLPAALGLIALAFVSPQQVGRFAADMNLISIFPFCIPLLILFLVWGGLDITKWSLLQLSRITKKSRFKTIIPLAQFIVLVLISLKFLNNYLSKPYTLEYSGDFYVPFWRLISIAKVFPDSTFVRDASGILLVKQSPVLGFLAHELNSQKEVVFSPVFRIVLVATSLLVLLIAFFVFRQEQHTASRKVKYS